MQLAKVVIVGYTNAGKSTLLNRLTDAGVLVEDRLFATLDATTRRLALPGGEQVLVTDTVGFIRKLPHQLVEAFRCLDVATDADLLVHVVDASAPDVAGNIRAVREVLGAIGADHVPELLVFNKADLARRRPSARWCCTRARWRSAPPPARASSASETVGDRRSPPWSSWSSPTSGATCWPQPTGPARCWVRRRARVACTRGRFDDVTVGRFREYVVP